MHNTEVNSIKQQIRKQEGLKLKAIRKSIRQVILFLPVKVNKEPLPIFENEWYDHETEL